MEIWKSTMHTKLDMLWFYRSTSCQEVTLIFTSLFLFGLNKQEIMCLIMSFRGAGMQNYSLKVINVKFLCHSNYVSLSIFKQ